MPGITSVSLTTAQIALMLQYNVKIMQKKKDILALEADLEMDSWRKWSVWLAFHFNGKEQTVSDLAKLNNFFFLNWVLIWAHMRFPSVLGCVWMNSSCFCCFNQTGLAWQKSVTLGEGASASRASSCYQVGIFLWISPFLQTVGGFCYGSSVIKRIILYFKGYFFIWYQTAAGTTWIYTWGGSSAICASTFCRKKLFRFYLKNLFLHWICNAASCINPWL